MLSPEAQKLMIDAFVSAAKSLERIAAAYPVPPETKPETEMDRLNRALNRRAP